MRVSIGDSKFQLNKYLSHGLEGVVYEAESITNPGQKLVVKAIFWDQNSFRNEQNALRLMDRLVASDSKRMIIVQPRIEGTDLETLLKGHISGEAKEDLLSKYYQLPQAFYNQWGLLHGDIRPANVIVDSNFNVHLIDFGRTIKAPTDKETLDALMKKEMDIARNEMDFVYLSRDAHLALNNPLDPKSEKIVNTYARTLTLRGHEHDAIEFQRRFALIRIG